MGLGKGRESAGEAGRKGPEEWLRTLHPAPVSGVLLEGVRGEARLPTLPGLLLASQAGRGAPVREKWPTDGCDGTRKV